MSAARTLLRAGSRRRAAFVYGALLFLAACRPWEVRAQEIPAGYDEGIIAIAAQDLSVLTSLVLVDSAGQVLLPLRQIAQHVGLTVSRPDSARLLIPRLDGGFTTLDVVTRIISGAGAPIPLAPAEIVVRGEEVYLTAERIGVLLEGNATLDMATLSLVLDRIPTFPAQQQVQIDQRRAVLIARDQHNRAADGIDVPYVPMTNVGMLDWAVTSSYLDPRRLTQFRAQLGAAVWGGALSLGASATGGSESNQYSPHEFFARYHRAFPDGERLTQIGIGDIVTTGLFARYVRGIQATNAPQQRSYDLGEILVRPDLPAGWQYEVLQNGQLLGFSDAVTQDAVAVPLRLGATPVVVRMYGPGGQEVVNTLLYQTPTTLLERGRFEYAAAAGKCVDDSCERFGQLDARYGGWTSLTFGGGAEYMSDSTGTALRPYGLASFTTGTAFTGELQIMPDAVYRGSFMAFPRESSSARVSLGFSEPGYGRVSVLPDSKGRWDADASWDERLDTPFGPFRNLRATIGGIGFTDGTIAHRRATVAGTLNGGYAEVGWEKAPGSHAIVRAQTSLLLPALHARLNLRPVFTGGLGVSRTGLALISAGAIAQQERIGTVSLNADWTRGNSSPRFTLSFQRTFEGLLAVTRLTAGPRENNGSVSLSGSVFAAPDGDLAVSGVPREGYGGVYGSVFLDNDMDGVFSPGDEPVGDAALIVGDARATANQAGAYHAWALLPYTALRVSIDSSSIADPTWVTAKAALYARPVPNTAVRVDIALLRTSELTGRVIAGEGVPTAGGITVQLVPANGGDTTSITTFSDGEYYVSRVRPGLYTVRVAPSSLAALGAIPDPSAIQIQVRPGEALLEVPALVLRPGRLPGVSLTRSGRNSDTVRLPSTIIPAVAAATTYRAQVRRGGIESRTVSGTDTVAAAWRADSTPYQAKTYASGPKIALTTGSHSSGSAVMRIGFWMVLLALGVLAGLSLTAPSRVSAQATVGVSVTILPPADAQPELVKVHLEDGRMRAETVRRGQGSALLRTAVVSPAAQRARKPQRNASKAKDRETANIGGSETAAEAAVGDTVEPVTVIQVISSNS